MASIVRLCGRTYGNKLLNAEKNIFLFLRPVTIKPTKATQPCQEGYDERNMKIGRPYSPHLTIYQLQLTTFTSLTHRTTGILLSGFTMILGIGALVPDNGLITLIDFVHDNTALLYLTKFGLAFPFAYHLSNGVRHLLWDTGKFLSIKEVYTTGYAAIILSLGLGAALAIL